MAALAGQLLFFAVVAALTGGVDWVVVMRKPRPPLDEATDDEDADW